MLYLLGINLPDKKLVSIALRSIYGIGHKTAQQICHKLEIHPQCRLEHLSQQKTTLLSQTLNSMPLDTAIRKQVYGRIKELVQLGTYRGLRHSMGKPVKGQRTRTNAHTAKKLNARRVQ